MSIIKQTKSNTAIMCRAKKNDSDSIQYSGIKLAEPSILKCVQHRYIHTYKDTYFHMIKNSAKPVAFYSHAKKVVVAKINTADCISLAVLPIHA